MLLIILAIVGMLLPVLLFQWWLYRSYGASPSLVDRLFGEDGYTAQWGRRHYNKLQERQPGEAEKRKQKDRAYPTYPSADTAQQRPPVEDMRPRIARLDDTAADDDAPPVPLSELLADNTESTDRT